MAAQPVANAEIADALERVADLLEAQEANAYRVRAYRNAAATIRAHDEPLGALYERGGTAALDALPTIGRTIAAHVAELLQRGSLALLDRLEGESSPEQLLLTVPGLGPELASRIVHDLGVETLEELEVAAHDGRLTSVPGFGPRRVRAVREQLGSMLGRSARRRARRSAWIESHRSAGGPAAAHAPRRPGVATLLAVDADYRERARRGALRTIAPRRFNPRGEAWLPVLHTDRDGWHATALFSNTARAHQLGRTRDWVVVYYARDGDEGQCTVVDETRGELAGRRVVRGREVECRAHYAEEAAARDGASSASPGGAR
ncbi:MAG: helix-hairpin-helix domain-containing protein [Myxococcota bacterium]